MVRVCAAGFVAVRVFRVGGFGACSSRCGCMVGDRCVYVVTWVYDSRFFLWKALVLKWDVPPDGSLFFSFLFFMILGCCSECVDFEPNHASRNGQFPGTFSSLQHGMICRRVLFCAVEITMLALRAKRYVKRICAFHVATAVP